MHSHRLTYFSVIRFDFSALAAEKSSYVGTSA